MSTRRILRYEVPVDDRPHTFKLLRPPVHVAAIDGGRTVEFWAESWVDAADGDFPEYTFQVFGTGHPLPTGAAWVGTCDRVRGLVWHLYELRDGS